MLTFMKVTVLQHVINNSNIICNNGVLLTVDMEMLTVLIVLLIKSCRSYDNPPVGDYQHLYPYGSPDATVSNGDDGSSSEIAIAPFGFFGVQYDSLYVCF